jgi:hypothetical protein
MQKFVFSFLLGLLAFCGASAQTTTTTTPATAVADTVALKEYAGKYKFEGLPFEYIEFSLKDGVLNVQAGDQGGPMVQNKEVPEKFDAADGQAKITFVRNEEKKVVRVSIDYQGMMLEGKKE